MTRSSAKLREIAVTKHIASVHPVGCESSTVLDRVVAIFEELVMSRVIEIGIAYSILHYTLLQRVDSLQFDMQKDREQLSLIRIRQL